MDDMRHLHYILRVKKGSRAPERRMETPRKTQSEVLSVFGYHVDESGVFTGSRRLIPYPARDIGPPH
jgi:hypothetical protein